MNDGCLPEEFRQHQIDDIHFEEAYDLMEPQHRVWIKTTLALTGAFYSIFPGRTISTQANMSIGFQLQKTFEPFHWTILLLDEHYMSAPRVAAAIMPAQLAGVKNIIAVWTSKSNRLTAEEISPILLTTLELSGVHIALTLTHTEIPLLIHQLTKIGIGNLLYFLKEEDILHISTIPVIPSWKEYTSHRLVIEKDAGINTEILQWAHPHSTIEQIATEPYSEDIPDALYCANSSSKSYTSYRIPRIFHNGLEAYWIHPTLSPTSFLHTTWDLSLLKQD